MVELSENDHIIPMGTIHVKNGNLLHATEKYIAHQCNCVSIKAAHLSWQVFNRYPYANIYKERTRLWTPPEGMQMGDIVIRGDGVKQRLIINMLGQYFPGSAKYGKDNAKAREAAFALCLSKIADIPDLDSIAFPFGIGCGAAGGNWIKYRHMIKEFADLVNASVVVYKLV